jgi:hypothetical protein
MQIKLALALCWAIAGGTPMALEAAPPTRTDSEAPPLEPSMRLALPRQ